MAHRKLGLIVLIVVLVLLGAGGFYWYNSNGRGPSYRTAPAERGELLSTISATGTLNAVVTVQVGTQVSGTIQQLLVDFNSPVKKGMLIARIDPATFEAKVNQAQADLENARASVLNQRAAVSQGRLQRDHPSGLDQDHRLHRRRPRAMGGIGDLLTMTPGLRALAIKYPNAQIDFAIPKPFHPIFENFHEVRLLDINEDDIDLSRYHRWINLTDCPADRTESRQYPNVRSNRIAVFARAMGIRKWRIRWSVGFKPVYRVKPEEISWAEEYLADINPRGLPVIGVQPLAADTYKSWSHMEMLVRQLSTDHLVLVFHHREINGFAFDNVIKVRETFRRCAALVGQCSRMVVVDSSFLHLSGALGIPTIALFFATSGRVVTRYYRNVRKCTPEKSDFPCNPCWRNEHKPCHLTNGRESICARSITVEQVMGALTTDVEHWRVKSNPLARLKT